MFFRIYVLLILCLPVFSAPLQADELTRIIQQDLTTLGYDVGGVDGEMNTKTVIAISKFQSEHQLEVTGEASPQLAGIIKAQLSGSATNSAKPAVAQTAPATRTEGELKAAQQACLEQKIAAQQEANKKKSGFGKLLRAATRTMGTFGNSELASQVSRTTHEVYSANASYEDVKSAAKDLGLTEDDVESCRNP
ncbi:MAG TPA: peptidoglycan-binding domain-containing protein [Xanthomonadales bacterium]|nr:peptidoglycan-binding domain-containing protein [Xanthomonadales bacterium]